MDRVALRDWTVGTKAEPVVRVGVILDADAQASVHLQIPRQPRYRLLIDESPSLEPEPPAALELRLADRGLELRIGDQPLRRAAVVRIAAALPLPLTTGAGVLVREVTAGRGFHWQKRIDQTLAGVLELRPGSRGVVLTNELPLEDYLAGVITAEMSPACPADFLKAQTVVARSWLLAMTESKHADAGFDRCNDDCCQRYQGTQQLNAESLAAARGTRGEVLLDPRGQVLDANYAKSCGGITETPLAVWGRDKPGVMPVVDAPADAAEQRFFPVTDANIDEYLDGAWLAGTRCCCGPNAVPPETIGRYLGRVDAADDYFRWTVRYPRTELEELLREKLPAARALVELRDLRVRARGASGRAYAVEAEWLDSNGQSATTRIDGEYHIRQVLHRRFLYSSAFAVRCSRDGDGRVTELTLRGAGWGHGVGLCQIGALGMSLAGNPYEAICRHYFPAATFASVYA